MALIRIPQRQPVRPPHITKLAFKQRMTAAERIAIRTRAATDPIVADFLDLVNDATFIDLNHEENAMGLAYLEQQGDLDEGRANEILTSPIQPIERV
jgi:hypothetical protein